MLQSMEARKKRGTIESRLWAHMMDGSDEQRQQTATAAATIFYTGVRPGLKKEPVSDVDSLFFLLSQLFRQKARTAVFWRSSPSIWESRERACTAATSE